MMFWVLMFVLCAAAAFVISLPLMRQYEKPDYAAQDSAIYEDQLLEVGRDQAAGSIDAHGADAARVEIRRRLAKAHIAVGNARPLSERSRLLIMTFALALVIVSAVGLYAKLGSPSLPNDIKMASTEDQVADMVAKIEAHLKTSPGDAEGWRMLGWARFNTQHFAQSAEAFAKALALVPDNIGYKSAYAEALVQVAKGNVTPQAQQLFSEVLAKDPTEYRARYYDALAREQSGDPNGALDLWIAFLKDTPADAAWRDDVTQRIAILGKTTGRDVTAAIQSKPKSAELPSTDQQAMIKAMVAKFAGRLTANPNDPDGWIKLIRYYQVLHDPTAAKETLNKALSIFANDPATKLKITDAASELGVK